MRLLPIFLALPLLALQAHAQTAPPQSAYPAASAPSTGTPAPNATAPTTPAHHRMTWKQRFTQANLAHDGHLTMQEASGGDPSLARHFTEIDADKKGLPQQEAEAGKSAAGELAVKLGEVYYGFGDYQKAADAINQALQKGNIKHQDEAYVYLALADAQLKNYADAKKAVANLKSVPNIGPRVLKVWELYGATLGMPAAS